MSALSRGKPKEPEAGSALQLFNTKFHSQSNGLAPAGSPVPRSNPLCRFASPRSGELDSPTINPSVVISKELIPQKIDGGS